MRQLFILMSMTLGLLLAGWSEPPSETPPTSTSQESQAEEAAPSAPAQGQPQEEQVSGFKLMVIAYMAFWLALFVFLIILWRRHGKSQDELQSLQARLEEAEAAVQEKLED